MSKLSGKHERFCQEYVIDYNGTQAAIRAEYAQASAKQTAYKLLQREDVSMEMPLMQHYTAEWCGAAFPTEQQPIHLL